ncbi:DUF4328 domain-containing protein [Actinokineospora sp. UTMC 2448]|uniref:DUF4328 domain-containing protein n=1 Tax=Actinokineospora sp. UTMC 2448 TaxID=2268449 RepID=UPI0021640F47|nr:DUF4328 domain-containing protein [Actinokineospora sp. UTMC 2448]UVS82261.1 hypothetical protein Actkin_06030 [Actinokineospora sp. UTMC 2448]
MTDVPTPPMGVVALPTERPTGSPNRGARVVASGSILLTTAVAGLVAWQSWASYRLVRDVYSAAPTVTVEQITAAEQRSVWLSWAWLVGLAVSWLAFAAWLWRARVTAARTCDGAHRHRVRWAVLSWLVPVANLWWPQMVVGDVHRASRPATPARHADLARLKPSLLVTVWWSAFLTAHAVDLVTVFLLADDQTERAFRAIAVATTLSAGLTGAAALAAIVLMGRIDRWQAARPLIR